MAQDPRSQQLAAVKDALPPQRFLDYREYLRAAYTWLKERLVRYSYLQFAEDLGFSRTNVVHLVIRGRRPLTINAAKRVGRAFGLADADQTYLITLCEYQNAKDEAVRAVFHDRLIDLRRALSGGADSGLPSLRSCSISRDLLPELQLEVAAFQVRLEELARRSAESPGPAFLLSLQVTPAETVA